jgi:hypothetical protein
MPLCYCSKSSISKMVSNQRCRTIGGGEAKWAVIGREEEEKDYEGEVHKKQKTSKPYAYFS